MRPQARSHIHCVPFPHPFNTIIRIAVFDANLKLMLNISVYVIAVRCAIPFLLGAPFRRLFVLKEMGGNKVEIAAQ